MDIYSVEMAMNYVYFWHFYMGLTLEIGGQR